MSRDRLVKGGQGRSDEEVEALSVDFCIVAGVGFLILLLGLLWLGLR